MPLQNCADLIPYLGKPVVLERQGMWDIAGVLHEIDPARRQVSIAVSLDMFTFDYLSGSVIRADRA